MDKDTLKSRIGEDIYFLLQQKHDDNFFSYEEFTKAVDFLDEFLKLKGVSKFEVLAAFPPRLNEPLPPAELDEQGAELEDVLKIPRRIEPIVNQIKNKGWVSKISEPALINDYYVSRLVKSRCGLTHVAFSEAVLNAMHILGRCNNPDDWGHNKQGLVMGMVQSGKTISMLTLMATAMSTGYDLFVILTGGNESLRVQTQSRLNNTFDLHKGGYHTPIDTGKRTLYTPTFQSGFSSIPNPAPLQIFRPNDPNYELPPIIIITILKEVNNLKSLNEAIKEVKDYCIHEGIDFSRRYKTLILDDESDYASMNVSKDDKTAINEQIVRLRHVLPLNCYVGYTATPQGCFAASPDSTVGYPKDFLWLLEPPRNPLDSHSTLTYMGLHEFFLQFSDEVVRPLSTTSWPHYKKDLKGKAEGIFDPRQMKTLSGVNLNSLEDSFVNDILKGDYDFPADFKKAMGEFILGCSIRWSRFQIKQKDKAFPSIETVRKEYPYHSMMFNLSLTKNNHKLQRTLLEPIFGMLTYEFHKWKLGASPFFDDLWKSQVARTELFFPESPKIELKSLHRFMDYAIEICRTPIPEDESHFIYILNSSDEGVKLAYDSQSGYKATKKCAIFLGGNILSRGLTIENLSVSVYVRTQALTIGDTSLQMCRWFGHKKDDIDILGLYIMDDMVTLFKDIARCDDALRNQVKHLLIEGTSPSRILIELWSSSLFKATSPMKGRNLVSKTNSTVSYSGKTLELRQPFLSGDNVSLNRLIDCFEKKILLINAANKIHNHLNRGLLLMDVAFEDVLDLCNQLKFEKGSLFISPFEYSLFLKEWDEGYKRRILNHPVPRINIGVLGTAEEPRERARVFTFKPKDRKEAVEFATYKIGAITGGERKGNAYYKGDRFFDKDQKWHKANAGKDISHRSPDEDILLLFYRLNKDFLTTLQPDTDMREKLYLTKDDSGFMDLNYDHVITFVATTPAGGPSYKVHTNKMICI